MGVWPVQKAAAIDLGEGAMNSKFLGYTTLSPKKGLAILERKTQIATCWLSLLWIFREVAAD